MNVIDIGIILLILLWGVIGFKRGFIRQTTMFIGLILIIFLAAILKNNVAIFMYEKLPFFNFGGIFKGVTVLNILIYEMIAFFVVLAVLFVLLRIFTFFSFMIEKILDLTIILGIPSKILGFFVGLLEGYIIVFIILMVLSLPIFNIDIVRESKYAPRIIKESPVLSKYTQDMTKVFTEIYSLKDKYQELSTEEFNRETLDILLKYDIITVNSVEKLLTSGKLKIANVEDILNKYR